MKTFIKQVFVFLLISSSGIGVILFVGIWLEHDFDYAWDCFAKLVDEAF